MANKRMVIVGGGLAGLSTGCYALNNGWDVTIVEHNSALGGVCTAWRRGPYLMDGCIHWLTGGPFARIYEELRIVPPVEIRPLEQFMTYRHEGNGWSITVGRDLEALRHELRHRAPEDAEEINRIIDGAAELAELSPRIEHPPELDSLRDRLASLWAMRHELPTLVHFRGSVDEWSQAQLRSEALRGFLRRLVPGEAPMMFALMILGYLARGWLSRPTGGTARFRDALIERFHGLDGTARLGSTVDEILVRNDRAHGVRLADGTEIPADVVVSTSSMPETVQRMLGGRYGGEELEQRLARWKLFDPIVLLGYGVALPLRELPPTLVVDGIAPFEIGGRSNDFLYARIYNDDPGFAPPGHTVVQLMLASDYDWWAARGSDYAAAKESVAQRGLDLLEPYIPGLRAAVRVTDVATPLTFWRAARSWRGAFEGWQPSSESFSGHVAKTLPGLEGLYMAGQWVEPGGGVPTALMSGRQLVQILCAHDDRPFVPC